MSQYNDYFYICLYKGKPAGYIGVIDNDIRVATHPDYQGKGIGSFMVKEIKKIQPSSVAKVKVDNKASLGLFKKCGFKIKFYLLE
jgi:ribosomal protein S18 acetylase RimI-like enzyme